MWYFLFTLLSFQILFILHQGSGAPYQELPKDPYWSGGFSIQDILQNCLQNSYKMQGRSEVLNYLLYNLHERTSPFTDVVAINDHPTKTLHNSPQT